MVSPYIGRLGSSSHNRNAIELRDDIRSTMTRIRTLVDEGDTQLANALAWSVNAMRSMLHVSETQACIRLYPIL